QEESAAPITSAEARALMQAMDMLSARIETLEEKLAARSEAERQSARMLALAVVARAVEPGSGWPEIVSAATMLAALGEDASLRAEAVASAQEAKRMRKVLLVAAQRIAGRQARSASVLDRWPWIGGWLRLYPAASEDRAHRAKLAEALGAAADAVWRGQPVDLARWERVRAEVVLLLPDLAKLLPERGALDENAERAAHLRAQLRDRLEAWLR
ncbi:MAG: hypothetical protein D6771_08000, partial [Zetaproteobacteria bacterium]